MLRGRTARRRLPGLLAGVLILGLAAVPAAESMTPQNHRDGVAIQGYDPVAYFTDGEPIRGRPAYAHRWNGVDWHFASAAHRDLFAAEPERYAPRYGGYCAYAMSLNRLADVDPDDWAIVDGRLYLNNNAAIHVLWKLDKSGRIEKADRHWAARRQEGTR